MKTMQREDAFILWGQWWDEMQEEWFKVEVLQDYSGEDEGASLAAWLVGDKEQSIKRMPGEMKDWVKMCQRSPAQKRRFRIIREPKTLYTEWELELYKQVNIPLAGEIVRLIPSGAVEHLDIPDGDIMIFDEKRVARARYSSNGKVQKMDFYTNTEDDISDFLALRSELSAIA